MNKIKVIIIDDERSSREELKRALKEYPEYEIIGEAKNADEAKAQIELNNPDLIFLDIQMPEKSGFDLLESLNEIPEVIFVTAFNQYGAQAFDISALDYLVKPIREERFAKAILKSRKRFAERVYDMQSGGKQIFIKDGGKCHFIRLNEIYLIESVNNYSRLFFQTQKALIKRSLRQWEELLDEKVFFRINRTQLVNTYYIRKIQQAGKGKLKVKLLSGELLDVSSRQSVKFKNLNNV